MSRSVATFVEDIDGRPIVIWGARATGMGLQRFARNHALDVVGFVDSDPALVGIKLSGVRVLAPEELGALRMECPRLCVIVAVSVKGKGIETQLHKCGITSDDVLIYSEYSDIFFTIDVMGACNLRCPSCAHGVDGVRAPSGSMSFSTFVDVVDKIKRDSDFATHISLYSWGEPFLHKDLPRLVDHLHREGISAALSTNLSFESDARLRDVIKSAPEYLKISLSGYDAVAYDQSHLGGSIDLVKSNLFRLRHYIDKFSAGTLVDVNYHLYKHNSRGNLRDMKRLCDELGFVLSTTYALVMPLERVIDHCDGVVNLQTRALNKMLLVNIDEGIGASQVSNVENCNFLTKQVVVNWNLSVPVCCTVFGSDEAIAVINFLQSSPEEIVAGKERCSICKKCEHHGLPAYNMGLNRSKWIEIADKKSGTDRC